MMGRAGHHRPYRRPDVRVEASWLGGSSSRRRSDGTRTRCATPRRRHNSCDVTPASGLSLRCQVSNPLRVRDKESDEGGVDIGCGCEFGRSWLRGGTTERNDVFLGRRRCERGEHGWPRNFFVWLVSRRVRGLHALAWSVYRSSSGSGHRCLARPKIRCLQPREGHEKAREWMGRCLGNVSAQN